jgi:peptidoglycan/LPS O-acetylase OafA/YrhL
MARNIYMLAGTLGFFALACIVLSFTNVAQQPGSPGDAALWRTMGIGFLVLALLATLAGIFSHLFEQAERRAEEARMERRRKRAGYED